MTQGVGFGLTAAPWVSQSPVAHLQRAAGFFTWGQSEQGHMCPITMTYAVVPALRADDALAKQWITGLASTTYDFGLRPPEQKAGLLAGMGMTEKQGGSDLRTNTTTASPTDTHGEYLLTGHKWFTSAPMNDVFLVLAQAPEGVTCFVVPRVLPDGSRNALQIVRLKDKLGNRSNASSEIELHDAVGTRLGDEGRGIRTIIEMVSATRMDCILGSASIMRKALAEASFHAAHRAAFGATLADQPAMINVLADLAVESEAATTLALRLAAAVDRPNDAHEQALRRIGLALGKFWVCKRTPFMVAEALECLGGNGYVEESGMPLLFRESPLNSIWEGSGNVNALDVLRALRREPETPERLDHRGRRRPRRGRPARHRGRGRPHRARRPHRRRAPRPPHHRPDGRVPAGCPAGASRRPGRGRRVLRLPPRRRLGRYVRHTPPRPRPRRHRRPNHPTPRLRESRCDP